ncbi:MAG TPA: pitrilysin family protein [Novimethylophilus sp.]|jgi:zinc protease|uniref:M16 family metallopeptidase n=1 Tax=Novimethylophilus sp. TaxID=2137426 RepID=UPI002F42C73B
MYINKVFLAVLLGLISVTARAGLPIQHWQSASGAQVYFVENHDLPILDVSVNFSAGSSFDTRDKAGTAAMTQGMLALGAGGLSDDRIAGKFAELGAQLGGDFDPDRAGLKLRTLSSERERSQAVGLFATVLQQPDFPAAVLEREKARTIAGLREAATQPESISAKAFSAALYGSHPYGNDEAVEPETVEKISRDDLAVFYRAHYTRHGAIVAVIGDLTRSQAEQLAEQLTAKLADGPAAAAIPPLPLPLQPVEKRIPHPAAQSHILLGYPGIKRIDPDYFPLYVGNYILGGGGFVSRLTEEVREKRGLAYSVYSYFMPMREAGPFQIGLQTKREQTGQALALVRDTLKKFVKDGPAAQELKAAKDNLTGGFALRLDSNAKVLDYLEVIGFYSLPLTWLDDYVGSVNKVTVAQIKDAFARRIKPDNMVTVVVGSDAK